MRASWIWDKCDADSCSCCSISAQRLGNDQFKSSTHPCFASSAASLETSLVSFSLASLYTFSR